MKSALATLVDQWQIIGHACQLILLPGQYQLILMDALDLPEDEMAKALRWSLKGLSDYNLDDVAIDVFSLPSQAESSQKKVYIALSPLSLLTSKRLFLESVCLEVTAMSIADMTLKNLWPLLHIESTAEPAPMIIISNGSGSDNTTYKLFILYNHLFYLIRELTATVQLDETAQSNEMMHEIERSIDYCTNELEITRPRQLLITPGFHAINPLLETIKDTLNLDVTLIDLNHYVNMKPPLNIEQQIHIFYNILGAIT